MRIEFNLITQRETPLDSPTVWYGSLAALGVAVPLLAAGLTLSFHGQYRQAAADAVAEETRLARIGRKGWDARKVQALLRRVGEAAQVARRCSSSPQRIVRRISALIPDRVRLVRLDLASAGTPEKTITAEAEDREALSALMDRMQSAGQDFISSFELKREDRFLGAGADPAAARAGEDDDEGVEGEAGARARSGAAAPARSGGPIRFTIAFRLAAGGGL
jgi:hypothetical protein